LVRNRWDGRVEGEAEGTNESVGMFEAELRRGPVSAQVEDMGVHDLPILDERPPFRIER